MDDEKRKTLELIEACLHLVPQSVMGYQVIMLAYDYGLDGDLVRARKFLGMIPSSYLRLYLAKDVLLNREFADAVAYLIDLFGVVDFSVFSTRTALA